MNNTTILNRIKCHSFSSRDEFLNVIENEKKILIAINADKILKTDEKLISIINNNIGYPDGIGAVMAMKERFLLILLKFLELNYGLVLLKDIIFQKISILLVLQMKL